MGGSIELWMIYILKWAGCYSYREREREEETQSMCVWERKRDRKRETGCACRLQAYGHTFEIIRNYCYLNNICLYLFTKCDNCHINKLQCFQSSLNQRRFYTSSDYVLREGLHTAAFTCCTEKHSGSLKLWKSIKSARSKHDIQLGSVWSYWPIQVTFNHLQALSFIHLFNSS